MEYQLDQGSIEEAMIVLVRYARQGKLRNALQWRRWISGLSWMVIDQGNTIQIRLIGLLTSREMESLPSNLVIADAIKICIWFLSLPRIILDKNALDFIISQICSIIVMFTKHIEKYLTQLSLDLASVTCISSSQNSTFKMISLMSAGKVKPSV